MKLWGDYELDHIVGLTVNIFGTILLAALCHSKSMLVIVINLNGGKCRKVLHKVKVKCKYRYTSRLIAKVCAMYRHWEIKR